MVKHKRIYLNYFGYKHGDWVPCENCSSTCTDIHHLQFRSLQGSDEPQNLMGLCRLCHNKAHNDPKFNNKLKEIHRCKYDAWENSTGKTLAK